MTITTKTSGFTLIELVIAVAVVAIIAAIAYPSYQDSVRKSRRADAKASLLKIQLDQEKWRANNISYASSLASLGWASATPDSIDGYYILGIVSGSASAAGFIATATPKTGGPQVGDSCGTFAVNQNGPIKNNATYAGANCW